jgi:tellurite methyltransferase
MNSRPTLTDYSRPTPLVVTALSEIAPGRALDTGSGEGRNSLYLARLGWEVVALDTDQQALGTLRATAKHEGLSITTEVADIRTFESEPGFDAVLSLMVLHFLPAADIAPAVARMQGWTKPGGLNVISAFTSDNPVGTRPYLFDPTGLRTFYADWETSVDEEAWTSYVLPPGQTEPVRYMAARLISRRSALAEALALK